MEKIASDHVLQVSLFVYPVEFDLYSRISIRYLLHEARLPSWNISVAHNMNSNVGPNVHVVISKLDDCHFSHSLSQFICVMMRSVCSSCFVAECFHGKSRWCSRSTCLIGGALYSILSNLKDLTKKNHKTLPLKLMGA